jgi:uncharacterized protein (TIGR00730 family)
MSAEQPRLTAGNLMTDSGKTVALFGSGSAPAGHPVLGQAERLGKLLAEAGITLLCGGYGGTMEAASRGAQLAGGRAIGVTMDLFSGRRQPNRWLTEEQRVTDFFPRLQRLTSADGFVVLRGGIGTLTEATLTWSLLQTEQIPGRPFLLVGRDWQYLLDAFCAATFITERDLALATIVANIDEAVGRLTDAFAPTPQRPSSPGQKRG